MEAVTAEVAEVEEAVPPAAAALRQEAAAVEAEDQCAANIFLGLSSSSSCSFCSSPCSKTRL